MAAQFNNHKKRLHRDYILKEKTLKFTGANEKLKDHWDEFVLFKKSDVALKRSATNKANAKMKIYHHVMGTGGYKSAMPKWDQTEAALIAKGITPGTAGWFERSKHWFYGHGGSLDPQTGQCIIGNKQIEKPIEHLVNAITEVRAGTFQPERENDELTHALGNPEHPGRTRGKGADVPWRTGFSEWNDSCRSRQRKEKQEADRFQKIERKNDELERILMRQ